MKVTRKSKEDRITDLKKVLDNLEVTKNDILEEIDEVYEFNTFDRTHINDLFEEKAVIERNIIIVSNELDNLTNN